MHSLPDAAALQEGSHLLQVPNQSFCFRFPCPRRPSKDDTLAQKWHQIQAWIPAPLGGAVESYSQRSPWRFISPGLPFFYRRNLRPREMESLAQGHTAIRNSNLGGLTYGEGFSWSNWALLYITKQVKWNKQTNSCSTNIRVSSPFLSRFSFFLLYLFYPLPPKPWFSLLLLPSFSCFARLSRIQGALLESLPETG